MTARAAVSVTRGVDRGRGEVAHALRGRDVWKFRGNAEDMDSYTRGGNRIHTAIRYGISQALLHAAFPLST